MNVPACESAVVTLALIGKSRAARPCPFSGSAPDRSGQSCTVSENARCGLRSRYRDGKHDVLHLHAVVADEAMAEVVETQAELPAAVARFVFAEVGAEAKIGPLKSQRRTLGMRRAGDFAAGQSAGDVDPVVDARASDG